VTWRKRRQSAVASTPLTSRRASNRARIGHGVVDVRRELTGEVSHRWALTSGFGLARLEVCAPGGTRTPDRLLRKRYQAVPQPAFSQVGCRLILSGSDRDWPRFTVLSGTHRARRLSHQSIPCPAARWALHRGTMSPPSARCAFKWSSHPGPSWVSSTRLPSGSRTAVICDWEPKSVGG
jgi:hypothetical protein